MVDVLNCLNKLSSIAFDINSKEANSIASNILGATLANIEEYTAKRIEGSLNTVNSLCTKYNSRSHIAKLFKSKLAELALSKT